MTDSEETRQAVKQDDEQQQIVSPADKGDDFYDFISKISSENLPSPRMCGFVFNPMTMEYEQPCGYGPNGEPEFDTDYYDD